MIIRSAVTYGAETWTQTSKTEKMLMAWERKILRKIYGPTKENGQWRSKTNEELRTKYKSQDIVTVIKIRRLEWLGHVSRMNERPAVCSEDFGRKIRRRTTQTQEDKRCGRRSKEVRCETMENEGIE
jgi:hypothetical protein